GSARKSGRPCQARALHKILLMQQGDRTVGLVRSAPSEPAEWGVSEPRPSASVERKFLTTVLFVDVVDSTRRAVELGDTDWLVLPEAHESMGGCAGVGLGEA